LSNVPPVTRMRIFLITELKAGPPNRESGGPYCSAHGVCAGRGTCHKLLVRSRLAARHDADTEIGTVLA
jgi:hypothetical protein